MKCLRSSAFLLLILASCEPLFIPLGSALNPGKAADDTPGGVPVTIATNWGAPTDLQAVSGMNGRIDISWKPVRNAKYYLISYARDAFADFSTPLDETPQADNLTQRVSWRMSGTASNPLKPGAVYYFRVRAVDKNGVRSPLSDVAVGGLMDVPRMAAHLLSPGQVTLRWSMPNRAVNGINYESRFTVFRRKGDEDFFSEVSKPAEITSSGAEFSFVNTRLDPETTYTYKVRVDVEGSDGSLESLPLIVLTKKQPYPNAVVNLKAGRGTLAGSVLVQWEAPRVLAGYESVAIAYTVARKAGNGDSTVLAEKQTGILEYSDTAAEENVEYTYSVTPYYKNAPANPGAESAYSVPGQSQSTNGHRLWVPGNLTAAAGVKAGGGNKVDLTWDYPEAGSDGVVFRIYREENAVGGAEVLLVSDTAGTAYSDETVADKAYFYRVQAIRGEEVSSPARTPQSIRFQEGGAGIDPETLIVSPSVSFGLSDQIRISWTGLADTRYKIHANATGYGYAAGDLLVENLTVDGSGAGTYTESSLAPGTVRFYRIEGEKDGTVYNTDSLRGYVLGLPGGLTLTQGEYKDRIRADWSAVEGATAYRLMYRRSGDRGDYSVFGYDIPAPEAGSGNTPAVDFLPPDNGNPAVRGVVWELALKAVRSVDGEADIVSAVGPSATGMTLGSALANLRASQALFAEKVTLQWNAVAGAAKYTIHRNTEDNFDTATRILQDVQGTTAEDTETRTLKNGVEYHYFITALRPGVTSNISSVSTVGYIISPPSNAAAAEYQSVDKIHLTWDASPGAQSYRIYLKKGDIWQRVAADVTRLEYNYPLSQADRNNGNVRHEFCVTAVTNAGLESQKPETSISGAALSRPFTVSASEGDTSLIEGGRYYTRIFWPEVAGAQTYRIQRKDDRSADWVEIGTVAAGGDTAEYKDFTGLSLKNYRQSYRIRAERSASLTTGWSDVVTGYRQISDEEFLNIVNYTLRRSMQKLFHNTGSPSGELSEENTRGDVSGRYTHGIDRDWFFGTNYRRYYSYAGYKDFFVTLEGSFMKNDGGGLQFNSRSGSYLHRSSDTPVVTVIGPFGPSGLYSGTVEFENIRVNNNDGNNPGWASGHFVVNYNGRPASKFDKNSGVKIPYFMNEDRFIDGVKK